jgi:hypothetical protein
MRHQNPGARRTGDIAGSPFQVDVTHRGYRASPTLGTAQGLSVYLDGVRVNEPFGEVVNWDTGIRLGAVRARQQPAAPRLLTAWLRYRV